MKLVVLVPTRAYMQNAGARIRYARITPELAHHGIQLSMVEIAAFDPLKTPCDVAIVSKCYDARALVVAALLSKRGIPVGVDLFDDYFSQLSDSRLCRFRNWLRQILLLSDFALCSTPSLAETINAYRPDIPVHVINDPVAPFDLAEVTEALKLKMSAAAAEGTIRLGWFGVGDNPHFAVGLSDLAAFRSELAALAAGPNAVELRVLTNRRALDVDGMANLAKLPVPVTIEEWSEDRERELLEECLACVIPVSAQRFSRAKSLNRALTALSAGCQVLSLGFPLYAPLADFIYRSSNSFLGDLLAGELRLSPSTVAAFERLVSEVASAAREADALAGFLTRLSGSQPEKPAGNSPIVLIHGVATSQGAQELARAAGLLSVASPFCATPLDFDAMVELHDGRPLLLVGSRALGRLTPAFRKRAGAERKIGRRRFREIGAASSNGANEGAAGTLPWQLALYEQVIEKTASLISEAFGPATMILSEHSTLPFEDTRWAARV